MALPAAASVVSSGLASYPTVYYDRVALDTLYSNLFMYPSCDLRTMPDMSGVALQGFDYSKMAANTTAVPEGTPQAGQALTQNTYTINLSNYADYITLSNKVQLTALSDVLREGAALLSYRGALSVDTLIATNYDVAANTTTLDRIEVNDGSYMTAALARKAVWQLRSFDAKPKENGLMFGIIHSLAAYDLVNDNTAAGYADLQKYAASLAGSNPALVGIKGAFVGNVGGVGFYESNAVPTEPNWQSSSHTAYHSYVIAHQAQIASSLGRTNLNQKNFTVKTTNFAAGTNAIDIVGLIAQGAWYNFFFGATISPTHASSDKFRRIRSESSIG